MNPNGPFILCATDFSEHAVAAATVAGKLALRRAENLRLVHVIDARSIGALNTTRKRLEAEARRLRQPGTAVEAVLLEGLRAVKILVEYIRLHRPVLLVMSSAVLPTHDRWAVGSMAEQLAEASPVPTLIVRDPAAFETWDWTKERLKILLALDRYATSDVVLRWAKVFSAAGPCDLVSCYINWRMPRGGDQELVPGRPVNPAPLQERLELELRRKIRDQIGDDASEIVVRPYFGEPAPCIVEIAGEVKAQLVAVGTHQRSVLGRLAHASVSRELLHQAAMNVVCVPVTAQFDPREAHIPVIKRVLVATDFSAVGNAAVPFACTVCGSGGLVKIIHVTAPKKAKSRRGGDGGAGDLTAQLQALVPNEARERWLPPEVEVIADADVALAICREAERFAADVVCVASHGVGLSRAFHGSVTKAVLKQIRRPLLVFRRAEE